MKRNYILIQDPNHSNAIMGVFTSGKKLADAAVRLKPHVQQQCLVKMVPVDLACCHQAGHDFQGTWLSEFLECPIAQDDTGE